ncbi:hypothetical protein C2E23DRAFT_856764 [Lenzites betulinus]|nr:hypothetical protein C2E23DRAFT_856764 [Lenzites betulinus]
MSLAVLLTLPHRSYTESTVNDDLRKHCKSFRELAETPDVVFVKADLTLNAVDGPDGLHPFASRGPHRNVPTLDFCLLGVRRMQERQAAADVHVLEQSMDIVDDVEHPADEGVIEANFGTQAGPGQERTRGNPGATRPYVGDRHASVLPRKHIPGGGADGDALNSNIQSAPNMGAKSRGLPFMLNHNHAGLSFQINHSAGYKIALSVDAHEAFTLNVAFRGSNPLHSENYDVGDAHHTASHPAGECLDPQELNADMDMNSTSNIPPAGTERAAASRRSSEVEPVSLRTLTVPQVVVRSPNHLPLPSDYARPDDSPPPSPSTPSRSMSQESSARCLSSADSAASQPGMSAVYDFLNMFSPAQNDLDDPQNASTASLQGTEDSCTGSPEPHQPDGLPPSHQHDDVALSSPPPPGTGAEPHCNHNGDSGSDTESEHDMVYDAYCLGYSDACIDSRRATTLQGTPSSAGEESTTVIAGAQRSLDTPASIRPTYIPVPNAVVGCHLTPRTRKRVAVDLPPSPTICRAVKRFKKHVHYSPWEGFLASVAY